MVSTELGLPTSHISVIVLLLCDSIAMVINNLVPNWCPVPQGAIILPTHSLNILPDGSFRGLIPFFMANCHYLEVKSIKRKISECCRTLTCIPASPVLLAKNESNSCCSTFLLEKQSCITCEHIICSIDGILRGLCLFP